MNVIMLSVIMLNVVEPANIIKRFYCGQVLSCGYHWIFTKHILRYWVIFEGVGGGKVTHEVLV